MVNNTIMLKLLLELSREWLHSQGETQKYMWTDDPQEQYRADRSAAEKKERGSSFTMDDISSWEVSAQVLVECLMRQQEKRPWWLVSNFIRILSLCRLSPLHQIPSGSVMHNATYNVRPSKQRNFEKVNNINIQISGLIFLGEHSLRTMRFLKGVTFKVQSTNL